jgi:hypothetical protein
MHLKSVYELWFVRHSSETFRWAEVLRLCMAITLIKTRSKLAFRQLIFKRNIITVSSKSNGIMYGAM